MSRDTTPRSHVQAAGLQGYLFRSATPLTSLVFIFPMLVFCELSLGWATADASGTSPVIAFSLLHRFFHFFGATGRFLPPLAVVGLLIALHVARKDRWTLRPTDLGLMAGESLLWALPVLTIDRLLSFAWQSTILARLDGLESANRIAICFGAGIYEELVFRLILLTALSLLFADVLGISRKRALVLAIATSAVAFAAYHYLGHEDFDPRTFAFRTIAGAYFGAIFLTRGFGITACAHAVYDVLILYLAR